MNRRLITALLASSLALAAPSFAQEGESTEETEGTADAEATEPSDAEGDEAAEAEASGEESAEAEEADAEPAAAAEGEEVLGPGGKPLRTDYPGTEESLKARMETEQIEGLEVDPDQAQAAYGLRIRELETKIDDLKEKVFQSKTRIVLLRETLLSGNLAGARAIIVHKTELGSAWKLQQAYYALDGTKLINRTDEAGELSDKRVFEVYDGSVAPGAHNLSVLVKYQGTNVGLFPYFKGYEGDIKSSCEFRAEEGKVAQVRVRVIPVGGAAESIEKRPNIECEVEYLENLREAGDVGPAESSGDSESEESAAEPAEEAGAAEDTGDAAETE